MQQIMSHQKDKNCNYLSQKANWRLVEISMVHQVTQMIIIPRELVRELKDTRYPKIKWCQMENFKEIPTMHRTMSLIRERGLSNLGQRENWS